MMILLFSVLNDEQRALVERIFHEHHIHFQRISFNIVKSEEAAEDVVSTAFIKIMDNIEKISDLPCPQMTAFCVTIFIAGALFISENAFVANIWSLPLTVLVQNQAPELAWEYQVSFPYGHLLTLTPAIACVLSYLLSVCYVFVMSLIIFWLNLRISKVLSYLAAVLVHVAGYILTIGFLTDSYRKFSLLANSLLMYHNINGSEVETAYLALPQSFLVYAAVAVMLFLLILHAIHSYDFRITVGTKQ